MGLLTDSSCQIHFLSFPSSTDERLNRGSARILPRHSKVPDWRHQLKVDEEIEVHRSAVSSARLRGRFFGGCVFLSDDEVQPKLD